MPLSDNIQILLNYCCEEDETMILIEIIKNGEIK